MNIDNFLTPLHYHESYLQRSERADTNYLNVFKLNIMLTDTKIKFFLLKRVLKNLFSISFCFFTFSLSKFCKRTSNIFKNIARLPYFLIILIKKFRCETDIRKESFSFLRSIVSKVAIFPTKNGISIKNISSNFGNNILKNKKIIQIEKK